MGPQHDWSQFSNDKVLKDLETAKNEVLHDLWDLEYLKLTKALDNNVYLLLVFLLVSLICMVLCFCKALSNYKEYKQKKKRVRESLEWWERSRHPKLEICLQPVDDMSRRLSTEPLTPPRQRRSTRRFPEPNLDLEEKEPL